MKKQSLTAFCLLFLCAGLYAQSRQHPNNVNAGGGMQWYKGDLGNSAFHFELEWYGLAKVGYSRYLNRSFDARFSATIGEIGRCFDGPFDPEHRVLMLRSRFSSLGLGVKYKLANGYLLPESAKLAPYANLGIAFCDLQDVWTNEPRVNEGFYTAVNADLGLSWNFYRHFQLSYELGIGYFTSDRLDFISKGANDQYVRQTVCLGLDF